MHQADGKSADSERKNTPKGAIRAREHWSRAREVISGTSTESSLGLSRHRYLLEKLDPQHRLGKETAPEFHTWQKSDSKLSFFAWLDQKEEKDSKKPYTRIAYRITDQERKQIRVEFKDGQVLLEQKRFN